MAHSSPQLVTLTFTGVTLHAHMLESPFVIYIAILLCYFNNVIMRHATVYLNPLVA